MQTELFRAGVLAAFGLEPGPLAELLQYNHSRFDCRWLESPLHLPLDSEPHAQAWQRYADAARGNIYPVLQQHLLQLRFPILPGMSREQSYQAAVSQGIPPAPDRWPDGLQLQQPEGLRLVLYESLAGVIPVLIAPERDDFVALVRALTCHNEPAAVPTSMGACMVGGFINWERIRHLRHTWHAQPTAARSTPSWQAEWQTILPHKALYQDCFILLSIGPYSGVPARDLGLAHGEWLTLSLAIRLEHECTHYFTRRLFGSMRNNLYDEVLADYMGLVAATGHYRADWFLRFVGLDTFPGYREGGRLQNYRGKPPLGEEAFDVLQALVVQAAHNLETIGCNHPAFPPVHTLLTLSLLTLEELASEQALVRFEQAQARLADHPIHYRTHSQSQPKTVLSALPVGALA